MVSALGFVALALWPLLAVAGLLARAVVHGWRADELSLFAGDGDGPRLAGWLAAIGFALLAVGWVVRAVVLRLDDGGELRPAPASFALAIAAVAASVVATAAALPAARGVAVVVRALDQRWQLAGRGSLVTVRRVWLAAAIATLIACYALWRLVVAPRLGTFQLAAWWPLVLAVAATLAIHLAWARLPRRPVAATACCAAIASISCALVAVHHAPATTLEVWSEREIGGLVVDTLFSLDDIRDRLPFEDLRPPEVVGAPQPDLVLVTIDTVRADRTPPYGGPAAMPALTALAERGTVFTWAFSPSNVTRRSLSALATGRHPTRVRGRVVGWALRLDPRYVLVAERLRAAGYATAGFMCCEGFWGAQAHTGLERGLDHLVIARDGNVLANAAAQWLASRTDPRPAFVWMHLIEPHEWTTGVGTVLTAAERNRHYDGALGRADGMLAQLVANDGRRGPPIVVVTADHGEALGEHGHDFHSTDLYNSQLRVPLVIAGPGIQHGVVSDTVGLVDLVPTLLELAGFGVPPGLDGHSFADLATGKRAAAMDRGHAFAAMIADRSNPGGVTAYVRGRWKLIVNEDGRELYDIYADPNELVDVAAQRPELVDELARELASEADGVAPSVR